MNRFFRHLVILTRFELADAIHSRWAAVVLLLYLAAALLSTNFFITLIQRLETQLGEILQLGNGSPGALADALWRSARFRQIIDSMVRDPDVTRSLMSMPPISLLYGFLAFVYTPFFVLLTASPRVAGDVWTGASRFVLFRTSRAAWVLSKLLGQASLVLVAIGIGAIGAWCLAVFRLEGMDGLAAARGMAIMAGKAWIYSLPFLGLAIGISQLVRSPYAATAIGFTAWLGTGIPSIVELMTRRVAGEGLKQALDLALMLVPQGYQLDLWRMDPLSLATTTLFLLALGAAYAAGGFAFFSRRDL